MRAGSRETGEICRKGTTHEGSRVWELRTPNFELRIAHDVPRSASVRCPCANKMWAISFTFKYLPNIIQKFCTHVAVRDTFALTAWASHVSSLPYRHHHTRSGCVVCDWASRLRKNYCGMQETQWLTGHGQQMKISQDAQKGGLLTRPTLARQDAPCPRQGRKGGAPFATFHVLRLTFHASAERS